MIVSNPDWETPAETDLGYLQLFGKQRHTILGLAQNLGPHSAPQGDAQDDEDDKDGAQTYRWKRRHPRRDTN